MTPLIELQLFIVVAILSHLDADIRIVQNRMNAGNDHTECGDKLVLTCYIDNYFPNSTMTWQNKNSSLTLVSCTGFTCSLNPAVGSKYSKSEDTTTGTFNLTIPTVTRDNNGISYVCENGLSTNSSIVKVRDYRPPILNETGETTLKVRSGCINRNDVDVLKFRWIKRKPGTTGEERYDDVTYIDTNGTVDTDFCTHDTECGLNGFVTLERTIEVEPGDANDYHLIAVIYYGDVERSSSQTNKTYKIGDMQKSTSIPQTITKTTLLTSEYTSNTTVHTLVNTTLNTGIMTTTSSSEEISWLKRYGILLWIIPYCLFICIILIVFSCRLCKECRTEQPPPKRNSTNDLTFTKL